MLDPVSKILMNFIEQSRNPFLISQFQNFVLTNVVSELVVGSGVQDKSHNYLEINVVLNMVFCLF